MAKTIRKHPTHFIRKPKTFNYKKGEMIAFDSILEASGDLGFQISCSNRLRIRARRKNKSIVSSWDDIQQSCWQEIWWFKWEKTLKAIEKQMVTIIFLVFIQNKLYLPALMFCI